MKRGEHSPNAEMRQHIAAGIVSIANEIADSEYQRRVWIRADDPTQQSSYGDVLGSLFDDYDVERVLQSPGDYGFDAKQAGLLRHFVTALERFHETARPQSSLEAVEAPSWSGVQARARNFSKAAQCARDADT